MARLKIWLRLGGTALLALLALLALGAQLAWAAPIAPTAVRGVNAIHAVNAKPLSDPMRPFGALASPGQRPTAGGPASTTASPAAAEPSAAQPRLQATRRNEQGVWVALIDERWRSVGERHGDSVVSAIRAGDVVLTQGSQRTTIALQGAPVASGKTNLETR
jgi:hypothetical protein